LLVVAIGAADLSAYVLILVLLLSLLTPVFDRLGSVRSKAWGWALGYIVFVYSTIPVLPQVWRVLVEYTEDSVRYLGIVIVGLGLSVLALGVWRRSRGRRLLAFLVLGFISAVYVYLLEVYAKFPAERLHLVEYGFMGYVLFRALRLDMGPLPAYLGSFIIGVLVGIGDECIQWVLPQRFFEVKDIQLNAISVALGLIVVRSSGASEDGDGRA